MAVSAAVRGRIKQWNAIPGLRKGDSPLTRAGFLFSVFSLLMSAYTLYQTYIKAPRFAVFTGCSWKYGLKPGNQELVVIPLTIANQGARGGAVYAIELTLDDGSQSKAFDSKYTLADLNDPKQALFAPLYIPGQQSVTASIKFMHRQRNGSVLVVKDGHYHAKIKLSTSLDTPHDIIDYFLVSPAPEIDFDLTLSGFDIRSLLNPAIQLMQISIPVLWSRNKIS